jgi:hypothetical protein
MQWWDAEGSEGCGPVRNGESGVVAGNERTSDDEHESRAGYEDSEAVVRAIIPCSERLQRFAPWSI